MSATELRETARSRSPLWTSLRRTVRNPMGAFGLAVVAVLALSAVFAPFLAPYDPIEQHRGFELAAPLTQFPLGTDELGRDLLSRIIYGARASFLVGFIAVGLGAGVGVVAGLMAGYLGGWVDSLVMRLGDAMLAFPQILLGIAIVSTLGPGLYTVACALAVWQMPQFARLLRSGVLSEREKDYVQAARSLGGRNFWIMVRHVLPNCLPPVLVQLALMMGLSVLAEASLSFLGLGAQPPTPSWGGMLNSSRSYLRQAPLAAVWPGLALALLLISLNYLADALRDALDPRRVNAHL